MKNTINSDINDRSLCMDFEKSIIALNSDLKIIEISSRFCNFLTSYTNFIDFACIITAELVVQNNDIQEYAIRNYSTNGISSTVDIVFEDSNEFQLITKLKAKGIYEAETCSILSDIKNIIPNCIKYLYFFPLNYINELYGTIILGLKENTDNNSDLIAHLSDGIEVFSFAIGNAAMRYKLIDSFAKLRSLSTSISWLGPQACLSDVANEVLEFSCKVCGTNTMSLLTIDPSVGDIESHHTSFANDLLEQAFINISGNFITDRNNQDAWTYDVENQNESDKDSFDILTEFNIKYIIASPIRSQVGASGALVAFYDVKPKFINENVHLLESIADQTAIAISFAFTIEQSHYLLDDLAGTNQKLSVQASEDGLTGLANHRCMQTTLSELCKPLRDRNKRIFSLLIADVDNFKNYNDTYGHQEGDVVLKKVGAIMASEIRQADFAARYGGEEFAIVLRGINKEEAWHIANRIRQQISEQTNTKSKITISIGVAQYPDDGIIPSEIIEKADKALYQAKMSGKNKVVLWCNENDKEIDLLKAS